MGRKVTFVELPTFDGVLPLASGYMETVCRKDPSIVASFQFEKISMAVYTSHTKILSTLEQSDADVYAFSCYVWNMGLVRRLLDRLLKTKPQSYFVLGGPQVMHQADKYLSPDHENVFICNGEGERTFANLLRSLLLPEPDFTIVRGLSFYHDKQLVTTEAEPRISDLSEIPSPFLEGVFEVGKYKWVIIETNRGCPFKCSYCYWGGAVGARVYKYDNERIEREIEWVSKSYCWYLYLADANWGMLKRDVDLSQFIVDCQKRNGAPVGVHFSGSKNTPDRVAEITRILHEGGLIATQNIALQTMDPEALKRVGRDNIKTSTYTQMQETLNQHDISSFLEIIWPLPGETLSSFQEGLALLCENGADSFSVYNLLLMNNVELNLKKEEYGLVAIRVPDPNSEAEVVVQTNEVDAEAFQAGMRYLYVVTCLYTLRGLWNLGRYLHANRIMKYVELFRSFVDFCWQDPEHPWTSFAEKSIQALDAVLLSNSGPIIHFVLHERREVFDEMLEKFVRGQEFWHDPLAQFFFEVDLLNRPYVYQNTPITPKRYNFTKLDVRDVHAEGYVVDIPSQYIDRLREYITIEEGHQSTNRFSVDHRRSQLPFIPSKSIREHVTYCFDISQKMKHILPIWRSYDTPQKSTRTR
jgi:tRNA A37 methylthiotransferase MiaB